MRIDGVSGAGFQNISEPVDFRTRVQSWHTSMQNIRGLYPALNEHDKQVLRDDVKKDILNAFQDYSKSKGLNEGQLSVLGRAFTDLDCALDPHLLPPPDTRRDTENPNYQYYLDCALGGIDALSTALDPAHPMDSATKALATINAVNYMVSDINKNIDAPPANPTRFYHLIMDNFMNIDTHGLEPDKLSKTQKCIDAYIAVFNYVTNNKPPPPDSLWSEFTGALLDLKKAFPPSP